LAFASKFNGINSLHSRLY